MKWCIPVILAVTFVGVVNGGSIKINATDVGGGRILIGYEVTSGTTLPVGFGLDIQLNNQATFGSVVSASTYFSIYPGSVQIAGGQIVNDGTPIANSYYPGTLPGLGTSGVTVEMGVAGLPLVVSSDPRDFDGDGVINNSDLGIFVSNWLSEFPGQDGGDIDVDGDVDLVDYGIFVDNRYNAPPTSGSNLLLLQLNGNGALNTQVTISANTIRGGIVGSDENYLNVLLPNPTTVIVPEPATLLLLGFGGMALLRKHRS